MRRGALHGHDFHREYSHPPRPRLPGTSIAITEFDVKCEDDFDRILELAGESLVKEEDSAGTAKGKRGSEALGGRFVEQGKNDKCKSSKSCGNNSDLRTAVGIQVPDG